MNRELIVTLGLFRGSGRWASYGTWPLTSRDHRTGQTTALDLGPVIRHEQVRTSSSTEAKSKVRSLPHSVRLTQPLPWGASEMDSFPTLTQSSAFQAWKLSLRAGVAGTNRFPQAFRVVAKLALRPPLSGPKEAILALRRI